MKKVICSPFALLVGCALFAQAQNASPQDPQRAQQPAVTFKTGVDLVAVDVSVVDRRGRQVADLGPDAFVLTVDGKPRKLVSAQYISHTRTVETAPAEPESYSTNAGTAAGRLIMLVVDQSNIARGGGKFAAEAAARFIDRLNRGDRVGLTIVPGAGGNLDFTANHALVKTLIGRVVGTADRPVGQYHIGVAEALALRREDSLTLQSVVERECPMFSDSATRAACVTSIRHEADTLFDHVRSQTSELLVALRSLLGRLSAGSEPKTVVLISEGLVLPDRRSDVAWFGPLASAAHVSLYVLRLDSTPFDASMRRVSASVGDDRALEIEGLDLLAGLARGAIFPVVANPESAFDRLAAELSGYYLLSFEPEGSDRDGKPHGIGVKVARSGVEVRARREFAVDTSRAALTEEDLLAETLRSPLLASEVPVKVTTYTFRDVKTGKLKVMIAADIDRGAGAPGALALGYLLVDDNGRLAATEPLARLSPSSPGETSQMYTGAALVDPGIYTLKLAVLDAEGRRGSVEHSFRAQLQSAGQLRFAELLLADVRQDATTRDVRPLVDTNVTADSVYAYLEMYSDAAAQLEGATATLEVAADTNGRALESGALRLQEVEDGKRRTGEGSVPVALLPPGSYVARAVVSVGGRPVGYVVRPFSISRAVPAAPAGEVAGAAAGSAAPAIALAATIGSFRRESALQPPVVSFFIERMYTAGTAASASVLKPIADEARAGRFDAVTAALDSLDEKAAAGLAPTFLRGLALLARGDLEAAAGKFRESIRLDSEFLPAAFYLGACYAAGGRDREAVGAWQTSLITEHEAPFVYTMLGDALLRLGDGRQALDILGEASTLWPNNDEVRMRLGIAFAMMGDGRQALATLDPYLERHPDDHERLYLALRLLYETAAAGRAVVTPEDDRARFGRYATAYAAANGPQQALVEEWRRFIEGKK